MKHQTYKIMTTLTTEFSCTFLAELNANFEKSDLPQAKMEVLKQAFSTLALAIFVGKQKREALKSLASESKILSLIYGYFLALDKLQKLEFRDANTFTNLDIIFILREISWFVSKRGNAVIPDEIQFVTECLSASYQLKFSKQRLDGKVSDLLIEKSRATIKRIQRAKITLIMLLVINLIIAISHIF
jgi:hypothetical protein